jgi:hypothetical protein
MCELKTSYSNVFTGIGLAHNRAIVPPGDRCSTPMFLNCKIAHEADCGSPPFAKYSPFFAAVAQNTPTPKITQNRSN